MKKNAIYLTDEKGEKKKSILFHLWKEKHQKLTIFKGQLEPNLRRINHQICPKLTL